MKELIEALQIFLKYTDQDPYCPTHCVHDILYIYPGDVRAADMDPADVARLDEIGFAPDDEFAEEGAWSSFRYGSC